LIARPLPALQQPVENSWSSAREQREWSLPFVPLCWESGRI
jgi:hypothetical protein